uniref:Uncharacterized protein n=1 Tax=Utricularia reniformis TaxID=192314 RepID=A0A1Y0AZ31_9LAMI|nr:hypothetical protein AEK19_MT1793 [Utricularia reniformis]ART30408.1 hypothetical protein AEK19_MT1793 [Utricularia reniformis]
MSARKDAPVKKLPSARSLPFFSSLLLVFPFSCFSSFFYQFQAGLIFNILLFY